MTHVVTNSTSLIQGLIKFEQCEHVWMNLKMQNDGTPYTLYYN